MNAAIRLELDSEDVVYVKTFFVPLVLFAPAYGWTADSLREAIDAGLIPKPTYVLPDGTPMVTPDYFAMVGEPKDVATLRDRFMQRLSSAARRYGREHLTEYEAEWKSYLGGGYGACLKEVSPEAIVAKAAAMQRIEDLLATPQPAIGKWAANLHEAVATLDAIERPFAKADRVRWARPTSRDRLITAVRAKYPQVFLSLEQVKSAKSTCPMS